MAYEVIEEETQPPEKQFERMQNIYGFKLPIHTVLHPAEITEHKLSALFESTRAREKYECDGIVVTTNTAYKWVTEKLPDYSFAFKMVVNTQIGESTILGIKWKVSKCGYINPTLIIKPVNIAGATIQNITGNNASFVINHKLGVGAQIAVIRSGDVIPKVHEVLKGSTDVPLPEMAHKWNETKVDLIVDGGVSSPDSSDKSNDEDANEEQIISQLVFYFKTLEVKNFAEGLITKLVKMGYKSFAKIIKISQDELQKVIGSKMSQKIKEQFDAILAKPDVDKLVIGSGCLGRGVGTRKLKALREGYPEVFDDSEDGLENSVKVKKITAIKGFECKTATLIASNLVKCKKQIRKVFPDIMFREEVETVSGKKDKEDEGFTEEKKAEKVGEYAGKFILFSGVRNKELEKNLIEQGGVIESGFTKKVNLLIVKDLESTSSKVEKAKKEGIEIKGIAEFN